MDNDGALLISRKPGHLSSRNLILRAFSACAFIILAVVVLQPFIAQRTYSRLDGSLHFYRFVELDWNLAGGNLYPRWFSDVHFGFGGPILNYYAPLSYYGLVILHRLGLSFPSAFNSSFVLAVFCALTGMYGWAKSQFQSRAAVWAAASAYALSPYLYVASIQRCSISETWALGIAPWVAWGFRNASSRRKHMALVLPLLIAMLVLTHSISALLILPMLTVYGLLQGERIRSCAIHVVLPVLLGLGIASCYWLPAIVESGNVQWERALVSNTMGIWIAPPASPVSLVGYRIPPLFDPLLSADPVRLVLMELIFIGGLTATLLLRRKNTDSIVKRIILFFGFLFSFCCILMLPAVRFAWTLLPLSSLLQFPWRLLGPATLMGAWLVGAGISQFSGKNISGGMTVLAIICLYAYSRPWSYNSEDRLFPENPSPADVLRFERANPFFTGTTSSQEFLPRQVEQIPGSEEYLQSPGSTRFFGLPSGFQILRENQTPTGTTMDFTTGELVTILYHQFYFPGWNARLDGISLPIKASNPEGVIELELPEGNHQLQIQLSSTPVQYAGNVLSGIFLLLFPFWLFKQRIQKITAPDPPSDQQGDGRRSSE